MKRRVAVTGVGVICAAGSNAEETWAALRAGQTAIRELDEPCVVTADDERPVGRNTAHELAERRLDRRKRTVVVEVVRLHIGHDGDVRIQMDERAVTFVGLHHVVAA